MKLYRFFMLIFAVKIIRCDNQTEKFADDTHVSWESETTSDTNDSTDNTTSIFLPLYGVTYFPWRSTSKDCSEISAREVAQDFDFMATVASNLQIFDLYCNLTQSIVELARNHQMGLMLGLSAEDDKEFERQKAELGFLLRQNIDLSHIIGITVGRTSMLVSDTEPAIKKLVEIDTTIRSSPFPNIPVTMIVDTPKDVLVPKNIEHFFDEVQVSSPKLKFEKAPPRSTPFENNMYADRKNEPKLFFTDYIAACATDTTRVLENGRPKNKFYTEFGYPMDCAKNESVDNDVNMTNVYKFFMNDDGSLRTPWDSVRCDRLVYSDLLDLVCSNPIPAEKLKLKTSAPHQKNLTDTEQLRWKKPKVLRAPPDNGVKFKYFYHSAFDSPFEYSPDDQQSRFGLANFKSRLAKTPVLMVLYALIKRQPRGFGCWRPEVTTESTSESPAQPKKVDEQWIAIGVSLSLAFIAMLVVAGFILRHQYLRRTRPLMSSLKEEDIQALAQYIANREYSCIMTPADYKDLKNLVRPEWLIEEQALQFSDIIGEGHFGIVQRAKLQCDDENIDVAVKKLHVGAKNVKKFLSEGILMAQFRHANILPLVGISFTSYYLPMIITPFMEKGDLLTYVKNLQNSITVRQILNFSLEIARGMEYLHQLKLIHRDLAARNCMLNNELSVKIADFGLCRDIHDSETYQTRRATEIPVRWMPPETWQKLEWTNKSDVWSYGVVLWELFSRGQQPYSRVPLIELNAYLCNGGRLAKPSGCPDIIYEMMKTCWHAETEQRPEFQVVCEKLPALVEILENQQILDVSHYYNAIVEIIA